MKILSERSCEAPRIGKSIEIESRFMVSQGWESWGETGLWLLLNMGHLSEVMTIFSK